MPFCGAAERAALKLHRIPERGLGYDAQPSKGRWTDNATGCLKAVLQQPEVARPALQPPTAEQPGHPHDQGTTEPPGRDHDQDLYPCSQS